jgi:hypothetical protein
MYQFKKTYDFSSNANFNNKFNGSLDIISYGDTSNLGVYTIAEFRQRFVN